LEHNRGAFKALETMRYNNARLLQGEKTIALQALTTESTLTKNDIANSGNLLGIDKDQQAIQIASNREERDQRKHQLELAGAADKYRDRVRDQITARWESEYAGEDSDLAKAKRNEGAQATNDIFQSMLPALSIAALRLGGASDQDIAKLSIGTKSEQDAKSIEALMMATSRGLVPQMQTLVMAYVKYKSKTGSGMIQGMRYPGKDFISFISGDMKGNTFLADDAIYNGWLKSSAENPRKMKIIVDAIRLGLKLAPPIQG
jgi:hypothetical protein